jgi:hypothetical protein
MRDFVIVTVLCFAAGFAVDAYWNNGKFLRAAIKHDYISAARR